jgi:exopolyphosphatase / guanosine-5'-triphosphate,3'-diphosphate pyrophosphatase
LRVAAIDLGTNSTRLLVADVTDGRIEPVHRESRVTGLGRGVETAGQLATDAIEDVYAAVGDYSAMLTDLGADEIFAFATSAARDASNSGAFLAELRERFALNARIIGGTEEAELTYRGARDGGYIDGETLVLDIGGGSTELIVGSGAKPAFNTSMQVGVVRHTERHLHADPPTTGELEELATDVAEAVDAELATHPGLRADRGVALAGTPAILAAIDLGLESVDYSRVEGHELDLKTVQNLCSRLASVPLDERRRIRGIDPDRAPTIVAGVIILAKVLRALALPKIAVSEHDILFGAAARAAERSTAAR